MDRVNPCCNEAANLKREQMAADLTVDICQICGSKHYEFTVDSGVLGVQHDESRADV